MLLNLRSVICLDIQYPPFVAALRIQTSPTSKYEKTDPGNKALARSKLQWATPIICVNTFFGVYLDKRSQISHENYSEQKLKAQTDREEGPSLLWHHVFPLPLLQRLKKRAARSEAEHRKCKRKRS
jgi:hypothetical protein